MNKNRKDLTSFLLAGAIGAFAPSAAAEAAPTQFTGLSSLRAKIAFEEVQQGFFPAADDRFGQAVATGDFNADGADDLATGIPGDDCSLQTIDCGAVMIRWGVPGQGLGSGVSFLSQFAPGSPDPPQALDRYGAALAAGDFNGDGHDDLAIGQPRFSVADPGGVEIHYGLPEGIQEAGEHFLRPGVAGLPAPGGETTMLYGASLAAGDFNGDGFDDLAIGYPYDQDDFDDETPNGGSVTVAHGGLGGLSPFDGYRISQNEVAIPDDPEEDDDFGRAVVAGDWNGDGFDDLAIGAPGEDSTGATLILFGSEFSLLFANHYWLGEFDLGTVGNFDDRFGASLASGDFNGDGFDDLVFGSPGRDNNNGDQAIGMITAIYGAPGSPLGGGGGFNFSARQFFWEDVVGGASIAGDAFGSALAAADFDGDGYDDLAIGTPSNNSSVDDDGLVTVLTGSPALLFSRSHGFLPSFQGVPGPQPRQAGIAFGAAVAAGDFDGDGFADLAIGVPRLDDAGEADMGADVLLYGSLFSDGFEDGGVGFWSDSE